MTRGDRDAEDKGQNVINRINLARTVWRQMDTVVILDEDNRTMNPLLQRFQSKLRHVTRLNQGDLDSMEEQCLLKNRFDRGEDMTPFTNNVIVTGPRWASLDTYADSSSDQLRSGWLVVEYSSSKLRTDFTTTRPLRTQRADPCRPSYRRSLIRSAPCTPKKTLVKSIER